ncbi:hypothetical protein HOD29_00705 [archaeon]|jgi:single-stranded DNA-specific DHH superfamily exonuclease|nr:hypothetical protein [archaeon]
MLGEKQINEIREHLEKAQNPLFYFDNDQDGIASYLILRRYLERGNGFAVKSSPMGEDYLRRVDEVNPDYIFILDQPEVTGEFFEELRKFNVPVVWIDHHEIDFSKIPSWVNYYNPFFEGKDKSEPTSSLCYSVTRRKEDLWLLIVGCISDRFIPEEYGGFLEKYPELGIDADDPFEIFYESDIGKIARMIGAGLKDRTTNVVKMMRFLVDVKTPFEVLEEVRGNHEMHEKFREINDRYNKIMSKAKSEVGVSNVLFFKYSGQTSMSADLANGLSHLYPNKIIVVVFVRGSRVNVSMRGKHIRNKVLEILSEISMATGGGHEHAVGAQFYSEDLDRFEEMVRKEFS